MPSDPSIDPADVNDDVARGRSGSSGGGESGDQRPAKVQGRRRPRRGRRRKRNPDTRSENGVHPAGDTAGSGTNEHGGARRPSPADLAKHARNGTAASDGASVARPALGGSDNAPKPGSGQGKGVRVAAPKPSDMAVRNTPNVTKAGLTQDAAATTAKPPTRSRRRGSHRNEKTDRTDRLRTVRETSAGGLVISDLDLPVDELTAALIGRVDRRGRMMWSLPKGHIETGETAEQTAVREVAEETGISGTVLAPLGKIDYWFVSEGRRIHKTVHHYLLRSIGGELSAEDYEVSEVAWVPLHELPRRLTYSDERRLARMARGVIADLTADPQRLAQSEAESSRTEPNAYERAAAARNQRRNEPPPPARSRRRRRRPRRPAAGEG